MTRISVSEPAPGPKRPQADATAAARAERRKTMDDARKVKADIKNDGLPKAWRKGRIVVQFNRVSPAVLRECPTCGYEPWKWQTECPRCLTTLPSE